MSDSLSDADVTWKASGCRVTGQALVESMTSRCD